MVDGAIITLSNRRRGQCAPCRAAKETAHFSAQNGAQYTIPASGWPGEVPQDMSLDQMMRQFKQTSDNPRTAAAPVCEDAARWPRRWSAFSEGGDARQKEVPTRMIADLVNKFFRCPRDQDAFTKLSILPILPEAYVNTIHKAFTCPTKGE